MVLTIIIGTGRFVVFQHPICNSNPNRSVDFRCSNFSVCCFIFDKKIAIKGYSIEKLIQKINEIPNTIVKNILLGSFVIWFFASYYFVLAFDVDLPYLT
jgi:uncharacterized membrane protein